MASEIEKRIQLLGLDEETKKKIITLIMEAVKENPCLDCPSNESCENFKWHIKWFSS
jgi:hypothetical protein